MKLKTFSVDFSKGINLSVSPKFLEDGECQIAQDCDFDTLGSIFSRKFKTTHLEFNSKPKRIFNYSNLITQTAFGDLYDNDKLIGSGYGSIPFSMIEYNGVLYAVNGSNQIRYNGTIVYDMGNDYPTVKPTATEGAAGDLDGDYYYRYTYIDVYGKESYYSPVSDKITVSSKKVSVAFTTTTEEKITHVNIYRIGGTLTDWYHVGQVAKGTSPYLDENADDDLSTLADADVNYPPQGIVFLIENYERALGAKTSTYPNSVWWSKEYEPEYWGYSTDQQYLVGDNEPCTGLLAWSGVNIFYKKHKIHVFEGVDPSTWFKRTATGVNGNISPYCLDVYTMPIHCQGDGLYFFDGYNSREITTKVRNFFDQNLGYLENAVGSVYKNKYYFGIEDKTLVYDFIYKRFFTYNFGLSAIYNDKLNKILYAGYNNNIVKLEQDLNDSNESVDFKLKSKMYPLSDIFGDIGSLKDFILHLNTNNEDISLNVYVDSQLSQTITLNTDRLRRIERGFNVPDGSFVEFEFEYSGTKQIQIDVPLQINPYANS